MAKRQLVRSTLAALVILVARSILAQECPGDLNGDRSVTVDEILTAVNFALNGCPILNVAGTWAWNEKQSEIISGECSTIGEVKSYTNTITQTGDQLAFYADDAGIASSSITGSINGTAISLSGAIILLDGRSAQFIISLTASADGSRLTGTLSQASDDAGICTGTFEISATKT